MAHHKLLRASIPLLCAALATAQVTYQQVSDDKCNCYLTNGTDPGYYSKHRFYDYRDLAQYDGIPDIIRDANGNANADVSSDFFNSDGWKNAWQIQNWNNSARIASGQIDATILFVNSPNNIYIEKNKDPQPGSNSYLTMRTARLKDFQTGAEFESQTFDYHYLSVRMFARTVGSPGAITAMFTYKGNDDPKQVQESDLEIRTIDPPQFAQYTNQPAFTEDGGNIPQSTRNITLPRGITYRDWAVYRMDWTPTTTTHFVNGDQVTSIAFQNPRDPLQVFFNSWSDGGSWSGVMEVGDQAFLQIQWIEIIYNESTVNATGDTGSRSFSSRAAPEPGFECSNVCSIDDATVAGTSVLIKSSAPSLGASRTIMVLFGTIAAVLWISA